MNEVNAIMDELHSLRDINVSDLDELGERKFYFLRCDYEPVRK